MTNFETIQGSRNPKYLPPLPTSPRCSPGNILVTEKGVPPFYRFFVNLYKDFLSKKSSASKAIPLQLEAKELLAIAVNLCKHFTITILAQENQEHMSELLSFMSVFLKIICSFPREFFIDLELSPLYVFTNKEEAHSFEVNQKDKASFRDHKFILCSKKTDKDYLIEINRLIFRALSNTTSKVLTSWKTLEHHMKKNDIQDTDLCQLTPPNRQTGSSSSHLRDNVTKNTASTEIGLEEQNNNKSLKRSKTKILCRGVTMMDLEELE